MFPFGERLMNLAKGTKLLTAFLGLVLILLGVSTAQRQQMVVFVIMMAALLMMLAIYMAGYFIGAAAFDTATGKQRAEEAEKAEKAEEAWRYRLALQKLFTTISMNFINLSHEEIDREINRALRAIGLFTEVERSYLSLYDATSERWHNSHEWAAKAIQYDAKQSDGTAQPWIREKLKQFQSIHIPNVAAMPAVAKLERERFEAQGIQSLLFVPMAIDGSLVGLIGFEWRQKASNWADEDIKLFELAAHIFLNALQSVESEQSLLTQRVTEYTAELEAANRELARTSRLKDEFLAAMSHELRTPLNAILGISEGLLEEAYGSLNNTQLGALVRVEESARHLLTLINDILDLSKIGAGQVELELSPVVVKSVCKASLRFIRESAYRKQIHVLSKFDPKMGTIQADERRLKQILVNLLSNAVKFTAQGGTIGLSVTVNMDQKMIEFCVWDRGIGIAQEKMNDLFKPFVQLDSSLSRHYGGTGLGLSLAQRMVELHHGKMTVQSEVGKGSHFIVSLPIEGPVK